MKTSTLIEITPQELSEMIAKEVVKAISTHLEKPKEEGEELLTIKETCEFLKVSNVTLWKWTGKGLIKAYGISNRRYYKKSELMNRLIKLEK